MRKIVKSDIKAVSEFFANNLIDAWSEKELENSFNSENFLGFIEEDNAKIISAVTYLISFETADLLDVAVDSFYRKKGKAISLLSHSFLALIDCGVKEVFLEVRKSNLPAISLYKKLGFTLISERKNYYKTEDALVLKKELK